MKSARVSCSVLLVAVAWLGLARSGTAQSIYKCPLGSGFEYTDRPCPGNQGALIHQPNDTETIDHLLDSGQPDAARRYAVEHHVEALYRSRLQAYRQRLDRLSELEASQAEAQRAQDDADAQQARQQALADERARLQAENDQLRQQNAQYQDALNQPVYAPSYWNPGMPRPWHGHHGHGQPDHDPPRQPVFHPCTQLAGGRVQC